MLPYLPKVVEGRLFVTEHLDPPDMASKRLGKFLDDIGITDPRKVVHSLRHRAQDRLRAAECPEDIRWAILGHEERTVAAGYGEGFAVPSTQKMDRQNRLLTNQLRWLRLSFYFLHRNINTGFEQQNDGHLDASVDRHGDREFSRRFRFPKAHD